MGHRFITLLLMTGHWAACGFFAISAYTDKHSWVSSHALENEDGNLDSIHWASQYVYSAYWAMTTLTTVGYGDITPVTTLEMVAPPNLPFARSPFPMHPGSRSGREGSYGLAACGVGSKCMTAEACHPESEM